MDNKIDIIKLLESGENVQVIPEGYSMYPMLVPKRDSVIVKPISKKIRRGDVVLYRRDEGTLVLHRVCRVKEDGYYMVGDNQVTVEGPLKKEQIKGILVAFVRNQKEYTVKNYIYSFYAHIWLTLRPVRRPIQLSAAWLKRRVKKGKCF